MTTIASERQNVRINGSSNYDAIAQTLKMFPFQRTEVLSYLWLCSTDSCSRPKDVLETFERVPLAWMKRRGRFLKIAVFSGVWWRFDPIPHGSAGMTCTLSLGSTFSKCTFFGVWFSPTSWVLSHIHLLSWQSMVGNCGWLFRRYTARLCECHTSWGMKVIIMVPFWSLWAVTGLIHLDSLCLWTQYVWNEQRL